jgi:ABC-type Fe3+/spermidine/putrescine transport system ATPase subunit
MAQSSVRNLVVSYGPVVAVRHFVRGTDGRVRLATRAERLRQNDDAARCIAGLKSASGSKIRIADRILALDGREMPPEKRGVNMVFQSYAVSPHMTVFDNVAYGLRTHHRPAQEVATRVTEALQMVGLAGFASRFGTEVSGGQQQRVAVARAIAMAPQLLFDEPLSNLDAGLREHMRFDPVALQRKLGRTSIYVTHDLAEAMVMSDRIILKNRGRIVQEGSPRDLYERPTCRFAAEFVASANLLEGAITAEHTGGYRTIRLGDGLTLRGRPAWTDRGAAPDGRVRLCICPENVQVVPAGTLGTTCSPRASRG